LKVVKSPDRSEPIIGLFDKIWCTTAYIEPDEVFKSAITLSH